jgi:hypothetical protein
MIRDESAFHRIKLCFTETVSGAWHGSGRPPLFVKLWNDVTIRSFADAHSIFAYKHNPASNRRD